MGFLLDKCSFSPLDGKVIAECRPFSCGNADLDEFFQHDAPLYSRQMLGKSYCFRLDEDMVSLSGLADLKSLEPFGTGFELPRMYLSIDASRLKAGLRNGHCFVSLEGGGRLVIFNCEKQVNDLTPGRVEIEGELVANVFRGRTYPEFKGTL